MTTLSSTFLVFNSKTGPKAEDGGLIYCSSKHADVQWPKSFRRGRPRKYPKEELGRLQKDPLKETEKPSEEQYEFVDCSDRRRPNDSTTRKLVRTHVMHNYRRQKKMTAAQTKLDIQDVEIRTGEYDAEAVVQVLESPLVLSSEPWGWDPFDSFPIKMQPYMHELLYLYISAVADYLYPIEAYWGFNPTKSLWIPMALTDAALLSTILFASNQFKAKVCGQKERLSAVNHLQETIRILNERFQDPSQDISDSTIAAVAGLAMTEQSSGNQANWRIHMKGTKRLVEIRGGLSAFEGNPILHDKLCRADIYGSVYSLSKPYLRMESTTLQSTVLGGFSDSELALPSGFQALHDNHRFDSNLFGVLSKVHTVTRDINNVNSPKSAFTLLSMRARIRSVQYYLLSQEGYGCNSIDGSRDQLLEACRLGILVYLGVIQNDFWVSSMSERLLWQLKSCLQTKIFTTNSMRALRLWILFLIGSLVFDPVEKSWFVCSIVQGIAQLSLSNWCDTQLLLQSFAWVGKVQDQSGRELWNEAMKMQSILQTQ